MASAKEFFLMVTQRIFSNWTALRVSRRMILDLALIPNKGYVAFYAVKHYTIKRVNLVLRSTSVHFQLAVEHDMGPKDSAVEFCTYITEVLFMNGLLFSLFFYLI